MRAILCGANGAMGKLIDGILGEEVVGRVSLDGENGVAKTLTLNLDTGKSNVRELI